MAVSKNEQIKIDMGFDNRSVTAKLWRGHENQLVRIEAGFQLVCHCKVKCE